jgi:hypothetical protein
MCAHEMPEVPWVKIINLYQNLRKMIIRAEELGIKTDDFLQPVLEQRNAFDHFMRAKAVEIEIEVEIDEKEKKEKHVDQQYDKMIGHLYLAFFDAADWLGMTIKESILDIINPHSNECIKSVIPSYYTTTKPRIMEIATKISDIRENKDIGENGNSLLDEVREYYKIIDELLSFLYDVQKHNGSLIEFSEKEQKEIAEKEQKRKREKIINWIIAFLSGSFITIISFYLRSLWISN